MPGPRSREQAVGKRRGMSAALTTGRQSVSCLFYLLFISLMRLFPGSLITIIETIPFLTLFTAWKRKSLRQRNVEHEQCSVCISPRRAPTPRARGHQPPPWGGPCRGVPAQPGSTAPPRPAPCEWPSWKAAPQSSAAEKLRAHD